MTGRASEISEADERSEGSYKTCLAGAFKPRQVSYSTLAHGLLVLSEQIWKPGTFLLSESPIKFGV